MPLNALNVNYLVYEVSIYNEIKHINAFTKNRAKRSQSYAFYTSNIVFTFTLLTVPW